MWCLSLSLFHELTFPKRDWEWLLCCWRELQDPLRSIAWHRSNRILSSYDGESPSSCENRWHWCPWLLWMEPARQLWMVHQHISQSWKNYLNMWVLRAEGYVPRFGVTYVDYNTLKRYPKDSARFLSKVRAIFMLYLSTFWLILFLQVVWWAYIKEIGTNWRFISLNKVINFSYCSLCKFMYLV